MKNAMDVPTDTSAQVPMPEITTESIVEALLFSTDDPLPAAKIAQILGIGDAGDVKRHIEAL
ncbi:MAG: hypothetical protein JSU86_04705, partial [Phycisphaerales bacterium]